MTTFDGREGSFENLFAHDEEVRFKVNVKTAKMLGQWVADFVGLSKDAYCGELVGLVSDGKDEHTVINKVQQDSEDKGCPLSKDALMQKYFHLHNEAVDYVLSH